MGNKYYITTAIAYTSGKPHIGNTYEIVLADAIARYKRLEGYDVYFQTGTDEHGEKIQLKAQEANLSPQEFVDKVAQEVKRIWDCVDASYDKFVRTSDPAHKEKVQKIFKKLHDQGDIYKGKYEGWYCTPCESFFTNSQLVDGKCPDCGREVHRQSEEAYFFKLSKYQDRLREYLDTHPDFIEPISRKNEMIHNFLEPGLQDLCVTRSSFDWGVKVPFDSKSVIYVWIDALSNYITNIGYDVDNPSSDFTKWWPADLHLVGKDIIRFHTIYWPIILMALDLPLPKQIFGHPWLLSGTDKMSKSKGNVLYADELVEEFGTDAVRYYLLHEIPYANDGMITKDLLIERYNSDLANVLGNLLNRTISMSQKYFAGEVKGTLDNDNDFVQKILDLKDTVTSKMEKLEVSSAVEAIFDLLRRANKYIDETIPWTLYKEGKTLELEKVLYNLLYALTVSASFLRAFLPRTAAKMFEQLGVTDFAFDYSPIACFKVGEASPLFVRIDLNNNVK